MRESVREERENYEKGGERMRVECIMKEIEILHKSNEVWVLL